MDNRFDGETQRRRHIFGWIVLGVLALIVVSGLVFWGIGLTTGFYPFAYRPFFFFPFGFFLFIFFLFFIFRFAFWGGWWGWRRRGYYYWGSDAKEILRTRYARGEITKEQFVQMMHDIEEK